MNWRVAASTYWCWTAAAASATAVGMGHLVAMDDNPAELALSDYSIQAWRAWAADLPEDCAYRNCGTLWLAADAAELAEAERKRQALLAVGVACEMLDAARLRDLEPVLQPGLAGALKVPGDGILYAPNAARWLLERAGPRLRRLHAEVSEVDGGRLRLADGRWLSAEALVLANGIHAGELCAELPIRPKKGHLLITDRYPGTLRHQLVELGYVSSAHASSGTSVAFNAQPRPTGQIFLGSSRQFDTLDPQVEGPVLARMLRRALNYLPGLAGLNAIRCLDRLPRRHSGRPAAARRAPGAAGPVAGGRPRGPGRDHRAGQRAPARRPVVRRNAAAGSHALSAATLPLQLRECPAMIELFIDRRPLRVAVGTSVAAALALGGDGCSAARSAAGGARRSAAWARARNAGY